MGFLAKFVMPGLVPGIHVLAAFNKKDVDGRDKPGHDEKETRFQPGASASAARIRAHDRMPL